MTGRPWWESPLVGFDLETTGPDPDTARIVTACAVTVEPDGRTAPVTWLVNPGIEIPAEATAVHGITTAQAREDGWPAERAIREIVSILRTCALPVVAFNAAYDFTVLDREARRHGIEPLDPHPVIDPYVLDKQVDRYRRGGRKLVDVARHYGVDLDNAHTAEADAVAAVRIAWAIGQREPHPPVGLDALHAGQVTWRREQQESLQDYFRRTKDQHAVVDPTWPVHPYVEAVGGAA